MSVTDTLLFGRFPGLRALSAENDSLWALDLMASRDCRVGVEKPAQFTQERSGFSSEHRCRILFESGIR